MSSRERATGAEPLLRGLTVRLSDQAVRGVVRARSAARTTSHALRTLAARPRTPAAAHAVDHDGGLRPTLSLYIAVGLVAGTLIALQIVIMRLFSVGWAHFGSLVISLAMLGFGLTSAIMCIGKGWFERNWHGVARLSLLLFGPLIVAANLAAQQIPINGTVAAADPSEMWRLTGNFLLYMLPFLPGAFFLGTVFLKTQKSFGRVYFADLTGSGLCGLLVLVAMSLVAPEYLLLVPLLLWLAGSVLWFMALGHRREVGRIAAIAAACLALHLVAPAHDVQPMPPVADHTGTIISSAFLQPTSATLAADRLDLLQDRQDGPLMWATLGIAGIAALSLVLLPLAFGWRSIFSRNPGRFRTIVYFACLGAGFIMVEVGLISKFVPALGNAIVSASVLITGMLVFSGLGSFASERYVDHARTVMPRLFLAIGALLIGYGLALDRMLDWVATLPYALRLVLCFALIFPPAFLMGFPMPVAMSWLSRLGKDHMFLWAWGINGCFSVVGAAMVPVIATSFGLAAVLTASGCAYLLAILGFFAILLPLAEPGARQAA